MGFPKTSSVNKPLRYINSPSGILSRNKKRKPGGGYDREEDFTKIVSDILCCGICCDGLTFRDLQGNSVTLFVDNGTLGVLPTEEFQKQYRK